MKVRIKLILLIMLSLFIWFMPNNQINAEWQYFIITAYYSPLPWQSKYHTGNYYSEIKLNWKWTHGASGKAVFEWMLAWPKSYEFGTKISFEWLWIWEIADRWWAIVRAWWRHKYDRIDIWMWYWYAWLIRAERWWIQTVYWEFVDNSSQVSIQFNTLNKWYNKDSIIKIKNIKKEKNVFNMKFKPKDKNIKIRELQVVLNRLNYKVEVTWIYDKNTTKSIIQFQKDNNIIKNISDYGTWYFWPKTWKILEEKYLEYKETVAEDYEKEVISKKDKTTLNKKITSKLEENIEQIIKNKKNNINSKENKIKNKKLTKQEKIITLIDNLDNFNIWDKWEKVLHLQKILKTLWFYNNKITWYFWNITKTSLIKYQINKKIIKNKYSYWAWYLWNKTKEQIKKDIISNIK